MKKAALLVIVVLLSAAGLILAEEVKITTIAVDETAAPTKRMEHLAVGNTYFDPAVIPDDAFNYSMPDVDMIIEGNTGIGTKTPCVKLQVAGEAMIGSYGLEPSTSGGLPFNYSEGKNALWFNDYQANSLRDYGVIFGEQRDMAGGKVFRLNISSGDDRGINSDEVFIANVDHYAHNKSGLLLKNGMVGIGTITPSQYLTVYNGTTTGTYTTTGWQHTSDMRLKADIGRIDNALDKIMAIDGVYFNWKNDPEAGRQIGFIAQDLMKVLPETVMKNNDGYYTTAYDEVIPVLVNAAKELKRKNDSLRARVNALKARIAK